MKISRNPQIAFNQGLEVGKARSCEDSIADGFAVASTIVICALANANKETNIMTGPKFIKYIQAVQQDFTRIWEQEMKQCPDPATIPDEIMHYANKIRQLCGLDRS